MLQRRIGNTTANGDHFWQSAGQHGADDEERDTRDLPVKALRSLPV